MGWFKDMFCFSKPSPQELYRQKKRDEFMEAIKRSAIITHPSPLGIRMENLGLSEYGARCYLAEGKTPHNWEKVLLANGDLITWEEWKDKHAR